MARGQHADFYFIGTRRGQKKSDHRINGRFVIPVTGFSCAACSGSMGLSPLPEGRYRCNYLRKRTDDAMARKNVGFSVDLEDKWDPTLKRMRSLLRIHPDGGLAGTAGCVGILDKVQECYDQLKAMFPNAQTVRFLKVAYVASKKDMMLVTEHGAFFWA
jgi:hypothetical protein